jgi:HPt (histidine-containing phosphotransfer) domain-containing protein
MSETAVSLSSPTAALDADVLDMAVIERIRQMQRRGAVDLLPRLRTMFIDSSSSLVDSIEAALGSGDGEGLRRAAHTLKSASGSLGAARLSARCADLEALGRAGRLAEAAAAWQEARADHHRVVCALHELETDIVAA